MKRKYKFLENEELKLTFTSNFWKEVSLLHKKNKAVLLEALIETHKKLEFLLDVMMLEQHAVPKKRKARK